uniref:Uncharacterized protein n=1 Tax=Oryza meridionalis TaxID=40149 RepID=A0A0E0E5K7_9ORYZ
MEKEELAKKSTMGIDLNVVPTDEDDGSRDTPKKAATAKNFDLTVMRSDGDDGSRQTRKKVARNFDLNVKLEEPDKEEMKTDSAPHDEAAPEKDIYQVDESTKAFISELRKLYFPIFERFDY